MDHREKGLPDSALLARCPYLGLHDDAATSLAYPSKWNYCYRVDPAVSISLQHQSEVCLGAGFVHCPVYQKGTGERFPSELRGASPSRFASPTAERRRVSPTLLALIFAVLVFTAIMAVTQFNWSAQAVPALSSETSTSTATVAPTATDTVIPEAGWTNPALVIPTQPSRTPTVNLTTSPATPTFTRTLTFTPSRTPTRTPSLTPTPSRTRTKTATATLTRTRTPSPDPNNSQTPVPNRTSSPTPTLPPSARVCGNALEVPFGGDTKFLMHRIQAGDNLNSYAETYRTTTDAIFAVNYRLPTPIWKDWVIVIPYNTSDVTGIPPFEPYQAVWAVYTLDELALQLNADPREMSRYNAFNEPCTMFSGWLIVPREPATP